MLLESKFSLLYGRRCLYTSSVQNFQRNTSEEEKETTDTSTCNLTRSSDIKQHQNCVTLWNKTSTHEEVIMTVKLWDVGRRFDYGLLFFRFTVFFSFLFKMLFISLFLFIYETYPDSSV